MSCISIGFLRNIALGLFTFCWVFYHLHSAKTWQLPPQLENAPVTVTGTIASIPEQQQGGVRLEFVIKHFEDPTLSIKHPIRVRLSWYQTAPHLYVGDSWELSIRLKPSQGLSNPGGFDYNQWLLEHNIAATGYIDNKGPNKFLDKSFFHSPLDQLRQKISQAIERDLYGIPLTGLITALSVGTRDAITPDQWEILRATGTNHLFAIAGLHLGFVTAMVFFVSSYLWRRSAFLCLRWPVQQTAAIFALCAAFIYSALAGFSLPTQRALIMTSVYLFAKITRRNLSNLNAFSLALFGILILDPLSVLSQSFWLSFVAVALIIYGAGGRFKAQTKIWHWLRLQWVLAIGLLPLSLLFFQQSSLAGFIANTLAIPWVGFLVLPLCVLGVLCWFVFPFLSSFIFIAAEKLLAVLWWVLTYIADKNFLQWHAAITGAEIFAAASMAIILLLAPKGFPARYLCVIGWLPLLLWTPAAPQKNAVWVTMLDVGRGLAVVVRTQHHTLLYDAGPGAPADVVVPYLIQSGVRAIDELVISQTSNNYAGGLAAILKQFPVEHVLTTLPSMFAAGLATQCAAGMSWTWDNIDFRILYPPVTSTLSDKNFCVLQINEGSHSILMMDNLTAKAAGDLLELKLTPPDILVAPISSAKIPAVLELLQSLKPQYFLIVPSSNNQVGTVAGISSIFYSPKEVGAITVKMQEGVIQLQKQRGEAS